MNNKYKEIFWVKTFKAVFCNMNDYATVLKMSYHGSEIDSFIDNICDEYENRTCNNCKHGTEEDGDSYSCSIVGDLFNSEVSLPSDFGCSRFTRQD